MLWHEVILGETMCIHQQINTLSLFPKFDEINKE
jgi:hypothetical protein